MGKTHALFFDRRFVGVDYTPACSDQSVRHWPFRRTDRIEDLHISKRAVNEVAPVQGHQQLE